MINQEMLVAIEAVLTAVAHHRAINFIEGIAGNSKVRENDLFLMSCQVLRQS